jgi:hypothetical protein
MNFKIFLENLENYSADVKQSIKKLPKDHAALIKGYKIKFEPNNTLKNDAGHIGFIDEEKKTITVAAPWNYGRNFTFLHEIAHAVWKYKVSQEKKKEWTELFLKEKKKMKHESLNQNAEEIFAMAYANFYSKHKLLTYNNEKWNNFVKNIS